MADLIPSLLQRSNYLLCILFEQKTLTLALFVIQAKQSTLIADTQVALEQFTVYNTLLINMPLLLPFINDFITAHTTYRSFAIILLSPPFIQEEITESSSTPKNSPRGTRTYTHPLYPTEKGFCSYHAFLSHENAFEYQLLAHNLSLNLTHILSANSARLRVHLSQLAPHSDDLIDRLRHCDNRIEELECTYIPSFIKNIQSTVSVTTLLALAGGVYLFMDDL